MAAVPTDAVQQTTPMQPPLLVKHVWLLCVRLLLLRPRPRMTRASLSRC